MKESSRAGIDRKSSIESEPQTLNMDQIQFARDVAMYVVNTKSIEDAMRIFTEGLEAVSSGSMLQNGDRNTLMVDTAAEEYHCLRGRGRGRGRDRDVASAPF